MRPLPFVWPYALVFWGVFLWVFRPEYALLRRSQGSGNAKDAKSLQVIMLAMWIAFLVGYPLAWVPALQFTAHRVTIFVAGVVVLILGSLLRRHCWRMLGDSFTGDVRASADQVVVTRGAYSFLRHPSYTAGLLINAGIGLGLGSWGSATLLVLVTFAAYTYRMAVEERALLEAVGEPYERFMRTRKRMIPFVY